MKIFKYLGIVLLFFIIIGLGYSVPFPNPSNTLIDYGFNNCLYSNLVSNSYNGINYGMTCNTGIYGNGTSNTGGSNYIDTNYSAPLFSETNLTINFWIKLNNFDKEPQKKPIEKLKTFYIDNDIVTREFVNRIDEILSSDC